MAHEFDPHAAGYDAHLAEALGSAAGDTGRFAAYKVDVVAHRLRGPAGRRRVSRVLDLGCGVGRSLPFLGRAFPEAQLHGFDPSEASLAEARARAPGAALTTDWESLPRDAFDCVLVANVLHHVPPAERAGLMKRWAEVLSPDGRLFIFEHNPYNPATRWVFERCAFDAGAEMLTRGEVERLGEGAGFEVVSRAYTLFVPFQGAVWAALQRPLGWLPLGAQHCVELQRRDPRKPRS